MIVIMTPPTHALLQEILDHVQLMAVDPTGEHQEEHLMRQKQWGHCRRVYPVTWTMRQGERTGSIQKCHGLDLERRVSAHAVPRSFAFPVLEQIAAFD